MRCQDGGMSALDDLVALLDLEPIEVNIFRGASPDEKRQRVFGGQVAGQALVAAARTVDDPDAHGALAARLLPAARRPDRADPLRGRPDPRRAQLHHPARRRHPARPGDLQPAGQLPPPRDRVSTTRSRCPGTCPTRSRCPTWHERLAPYKDVLGDCTTGRARSTCGTRCLDPMSRKGNPTHRPAGLAARRRAAARRPGAARLHRHVRQRHDAARHVRAALRPGVGLARHADGEPRPRDVVPPPVPRRRVAAVRPARALDDRPPAASPAGRSSPATAAWSSAWSKRA